MRDLTSPISPVHDYEPLLNPSSSEKGDRGFTAPAGEWDQAPKFRHRETHTLLASLGLNVLLLLSIAYLAVKQSQSIEWKGARPVYTPARDAVVHELVKFASVGHAKSPFDGPPTPEVDDAWKDLYVAGISAIPKSSAALLPNRTEAYTGDEMHYIVELDIFHQLHCLNLVRKSVWREFYPEVEKDRFTPTGDGKPFDHVDHCLNAIRESLTCNADLTPVTWHWNEKNQISSFDFDAVHTCVNWDMIHKWTKENTARVKFDFHHHVVDDLHFPDDPKAKDNFTITPGGQHADKRTENKLITFTDGVYLELIAFVNDDPVLKKGHHWGDKVLGQGVIDWCQSGQLENAEDTTSFAYSEMVARVDALTETIGSAKISYTAPQQGGRLRPDGEKLEWLVTFPTSTIGETTSTRPAGIPFFCHDVTSRALRLSAETPEKREKYTSHPCGATGVSSLTLLIPQAELSSYVNIVAAVSNSAAVACGISEFRLMLGAADDDTASIEVIVRKPNTEEEEAYLEKFGAGVYSFHAKSTKTARLEGEGIRIYMHP